MINEQLLSTVDDIIHKIQCQMTSVDWPVALSTPSFAVSLVTRSSSDIPGFLSRAAFDSDVDDNKANGDVATERVEASLLIPTDFDFSNFTMGDGSLDVSLKVGCRA